MVDKLLLLSGNDIPFKEAGVCIRQPLLKDISLIGERHFLLGCHLLTLSKNVLAIEDKNHLDKMNNFEILMSIMENKKDSKSIERRVSVLEVLSLLFPDYDLNLQKDGFVFTNKEKIFSINAINFDIFSKIIDEMCCLKEEKSELDYNPANETARRIAEKLLKGRAFAQKQKGVSSQNSSFLANYISILSIGMGINMQELFQYTIFQLFDEFQRFQLKQSNDIYFKLKLAGAKDVEEVDNWMKDIH